MMKNTFESFYFAEPCNLCGDSVCSALPSVVIAIELFSELYIRFMTLFKAHESSAAEHTRPTTTTTARYIRRDMAICIPTVLGTPGINYATSKNVYQDNVILLSAERE